MKSCCVLSYALECTEQLEILHGSFMELRSNPFFFLVSKSGPCKWICHSIVIRDSNLIALVQGLSWLSWQMQLVLQYALKLKTQSKNIYLSLLVERLQIVVMLWLSFSHDVERIQIVVVLWWCNAKNSWKYFLNWRNQAKTQHTYLNLFKINDSCQVIFVSFILLTALKPTMLIKPQALKGFD